ncbi:MAG: MOSC domain-containing protein [Hyphomicrobiaceae bacterium]
MTQTSTLIGIALKAKSRAPMETRDHGRISIERGLDGDARGAKYPSRQITILAIEDWQRTLADLPAAADLLSPLALTIADLPWTTRRANLLVQGLRLPRAKGAKISVGPVILEVTGQTYPCNRMESARQGLLSALAPDWRGGVTCRVVSGGPVALGDPAQILSTPPERTIRLPP